MGLEEWTLAAVGWFIAAAGIHCFARFVFNRRAEVIRERGKTETEELKPYLENGGLHVLIVTIGVTLFGVIFASQIRTGVPYRPFETGSGIFAWLLVAVGLFSVQWGICGFSIGTVRIEIQSAKERARFIKSGWWALRGVIPSLRRERRTALIELALGVTTTELGLFLAYQNQFRVLLP